MLQSQNMVKRRKFKKSRDKDSPVEKRMKDKDGSKFSAFYIHRFF